MISTSHAVLFYHEFYCDRCCSFFLLPCNKRVSDIPEAIRKSILFRPDTGSQIKWPLNPTDEEAQALEKKASCPNDSRADGKLRHHVRYIWPLGSGLD